MPNQFEILDHPADVGFLAYGRDFERLMENAALAMLTLACDLDTIMERESRSVTASGGDNESLLYAWLAEILATADAEQLVFRRADVTAIGGGQVSGTLYGEPFDKAKHNAGTYIKAVTYHQLKVEHTAGGWKARVYLDV